MNKLWIPLIFLGTAALGSAIFFAGQGPEQPHHADGTDSKPPASTGTPPPVFRSVPITPYRAVVTAHNPDEEDAAPRQTNLSVMRGDDSPVSSDGDMRELAVVRAPSRMSRDEPKPVSDEPAEKTIAISIRGNQVTETRISAGSGVTSRQSYSVDTHAGTASVDNNTAAAPSNNSEPVNQQQAGMPQTLTQKPECPQSLYMGGNAYARNMLIARGCPVP